MSSRMRRRSGVSAQIESLESRLAMSVDGFSGVLGGALQQHALESPPLDQRVFVDDAMPLTHHDSTTPDFWVTEEDRLTHTEQLQGIEQFLWEAHQSTGWHQVQADYGFSGAGQTVAVIDSGLAYDHYALGGGLGEGYRVVGGWDFSEENDGDPYDDGPSGSHGTHVGGIIGSSSPTHSGVAPDVDLVGLRVFNDEGEGWFSWVESALDWVHDHRNDFANPITAVNLSLGVSSWNAETIPTWASLEDEFAQLEADGIFVAVSAGNSYASYNQPGLSYPAASSYVVPVMSTDDDGQLSYFSQRHTRAIAAPGRSIVSTVPDYNGDGNGTTDDFRGKSGTSMAAPYVAGASVLVRQAMEFVGMADVTQDVIYDHLRDTADDFVDAASGRWYKRLNLEAAIDELMPVDDFGSTIESAYDLGTLEGSMAMSGHIASLHDRDYFTFTAGTTGSVNFDATNLTHELTASWQVYGTPTSTASSNGAGVSFAVQAGQTYAVSFASSNGLGFYDIEISTGSGFAYEQWGAVAQRQINSIKVDGEAWYRVEATRDGILTAQGFFDSKLGQVDVEFYDQDLRLAATSSASGGESRVDVQVTAGQGLFIRIVGAHDDVDVQLTNLVHVEAGVVTASGTDAADDFAFTSGAVSTLSINSVSYAFDSGEASQLLLDGGDGDDALTLFGSGAAETVVFRVGSASMTDAAGTYDLVASGFERQFAYAASAADSVHFYDSAGDDTLTTSPEAATLEGDGFQHAAYGFAQASAFASVGWDRAFMHDSQGDDSYEGRHDSSRLYGEEFDHRASGFDRVFAFATAGLDRAFLYDAAGDDVFESRQHYSSMSGDDYYNYAHSFDRVFAYATEGWDRAFYWDTAGDDTFEGRRDYSRMYGDGYNNYAHSFDRVFAYASEGWDRAFFYDTSGDDTFVAYPHYARLTGEGYNTYAAAFDRVLAYATEGGWDRAFLYDSPGDDVFQATPMFARLIGEGFYNYAVQFDRVFAYSQKGGYDLMQLTGSSGDDHLDSDGVMTRLYGDRYYNYGVGFSVARIAAGVAGDDRATVTDLTADAVLSGAQDEATVKASDRDLELRGFNVGRFEAAEDESPTKLLGAVDYLFELVGDWQ